MAWSSSIPLRGATGVRGTQLLYGQGAPSAAIGLAGDSYLDAQYGRLYGQKDATSGWPSTYASLIGPQGGTVRVGNGAPSASNPSVQNDTDLYVQLDAANGPSLFGPRASGAWPSSGTSLAGAAGASVLSGSGAPSSSLGTAATPAYLDTANAILYGAKVNGSWPTSGISLVGPQGTRIAFGTAEPGLTYGNDGDYYIKMVSSSTWLLMYKVTHAATATTSDYPNGWQTLGNLVGSQGAQGVPGTAGAAGATIRSGTGAPTSSSPSTQNDGDFFFSTDLKIFYGPRASGSWPSTGTSLKGDTGSAGLAVLSGSGAPASSLGVQGQPAYIDTTAGALYAAKGASAWPTPPVSLIGQIGPAGAGIYSGSGAPSGTNPGGTVAAGSFFIETDTTPNRLFGPYTSANGWPSTYVAMGGGSFLTVSGPPASSLGSVGDCAIDTTNAFFYPPKTASGWTATPINLVGPTGAPGPTTSYRGTMRGYYWASNATANTAYSISQPMTIVTGTANYSNIPLREPMIGAGSLTAIAVSCPGSVTASTCTVALLKNATVAYTATSLLTCNSAATASDAYVRISSPPSFAAGDVITATVSFSAGPSACIQAALHYTLNS